MARDASIRCWARERSGFLWSARWIASVNVNARGSSTASAAMVNQHPNPANRHPVALLMSFPGEWGRSGGDGYRAPALEPPHEPPTPSFLRMSSIRHQRVTPDWNRLAPTKAVNHSQYGLTQWARARL